MRLFEASDGEVIAFSDEGEGRPLVFLHGWGAHSGFFAPQRAALAAKFRVVTFDLRGSPHAPAAANLTIERLGQDVCEVAEDLDLEDAVAIGWSMGAMALWAALAGPAAARFAASVVIDMSPRILTGPDWLLGIRGGYDRDAAARTLEAMRADWPGFCRVFASRLFAEGDDRPDGLRGWAETEAARGDPERLAPLWASMAEQDFRALLPRLSAPTLIVHGGRSWLYEPAVAEALEALLPRARRRAYESSGHAPHLEEPERFNRDIEEFAAIAPPRAGSVTAVRPV